MTVAESVAASLAGVSVERLPRAAVETCERLLLDVSGLCIAARHEPYVAATLAAVVGRILLQRDVSVRERLGLQVAIAATGALLHQHRRAVAAGEQFTQ